MSQSDTPITPRRLEKLRIQHVNLRTRVSEAKEDLSATESRLQGLEQRERTLAEAEKGFTKRSNDLLLAEQAVVAKTVEIGLQEAQLFNRKKELRELELSIGSMQANAKDVAEDLDRRIKALEEAERKNQKDSTAILGEREQLEKARLAFLAEQEDASSLIVKAEQDKQASIKKQAELDEREKAVEMERENLFSFEGELKSMEAKLLNWQKELIERDRNRESLCTTK